jgi:hypothetical protein
MQDTHRPDHEKAEKTNQHDGADDGQQNQRDLHRTQDVGVIGIAALHDEHQLINPTDKRVQFTVEAVEHGGALGRITDQISPH